MNALRSALLLLAALAAASCASDAEMWGFVATLGNDTTSVELITRRGDRLVGEAVGRSPTVVRRRWEATLAPDGSLRRWTMDSHIPNAAPGRTELHHEMEIRDGGIRLVRAVGADTTDRLVASPYPVVVPWNAFVYGTFETLLQAGRGLPDTARIGQYFFEGWSEGRIGFARLRATEDGGVSITSTGLAGAGVARTDAEGRMLSYSGEGTTYLQEVRRVAEVPDLDSLLARFAAAERARGPSSVLSARDTARGTIGGAAIEIDYGRPLLRGRTVLGGVVPYDRVWRTGANAATHLTVSAPVRVGGVRLDAGSYTLWTQPTRDPAGGTGWS